MRTTLIPLLACAVGLASLRLDAETCRYYVSGPPVFDGGYSAASSGIGLDTGSFGAAVAADWFDSRGRTVDSDILETWFRTYRPYGFFLLFR